MAKEKDLASKSTLTTSDYIRVVGSDNASYKQLISAVMDVMGSLTYKKSLTSTDDCNALEQGVYIFSASVPQNAPSGVTYGTIIVIQGQTPGGGTVYNFQLLSTYGKGLYYRRQQGAAGAVFADWVKVATTAETAVQVKTVTGTTNSGGAIALGLNVASSEIVSVVSSDSHHWCVPLIAGSNQYARVLADGSTYSPVPNTSVSLTVRYRTF